MTFRSRI